MTETAERVAVVLAAHGAPATDYPPIRVGMLMMLEFGGGPIKRLGFLRRWRAKLEDEIATWPRTADNDPYKIAVERLADALAERTGYPVIPGYNEFCLPAIGEAIDRAVAEGAQEVVVAPTMLVRGNQHTESEIREAVEAAGKRHPHATIHYAFPYEQRLLVTLLADAVGTHVSPASGPDSGGSGPTPARS